MPITKNHATRNTVSMMYTAVKKDDLELFNRVVEMNGDIYDHKGNGKFFARALSSSSHKVASAFLKQPDFFDKIKKYRPTDFFYAITYGDIESLKTLARLGLDKSTLCIETIMQDSNLPTNDNFMLKACILAFLTSPEYFNKVHSLFSHKDLFLTALTVRDFSAFDFLNENKEPMDLHIHPESLAYIVSRACYASDNRNTSKTFMEAAYKCLDDIIASKEWDYETVENANLDLGYNVRVASGSPIDTENSPVWRFIDHLIVSHPCSAITHITLANVYARMLSNIDVYGEYIEKHQHVFTKVKGRIKTFEIDKIAPMLMHSNRERFCDKEARRISSLALSSILEESGIDTSDILRAIQTTGKESKVIKKAIALKAIESKGLSTTVSSIKHVSYINAMMELGYDPYELLTYVEEPKIAQKLTETLMNS